MEKVRCNIEGNLEVQFKNVHYLIEELVHFIHVGVSVYFIAIILLTSLLF